MLILLLHPDLHILTANIICPSLQNYLIRWNGRISEANLGDLFPHVGYQIEGEKISGSMPIGMKMSPEEVFWVYFLGETWGNQIPRQMLYCIYC